ncbi:hypothetical protein TWF696_002547 [Orbilia brochopaga]|uniref:Apple domain-containing protein n=1 Tax=Orbilia brochopaga TaxID=3140254 RepID=A0AAV9U2B5_9PEZI
MVVGRRRDLEFEIGGNVFKKRSGIPACCSACFLTSTKIAPRKTKTTTVTMPKVTARITSTRATTVTLAIDLLGGTETLYETSTLTSITTATTTTTSTHTSTETTTVTILPPGICDDPYTFSGRNAFYYERTSPSNDGDGITNISDCCNKCWSTVNCTHYMFDNLANTCTMYTVNPDNINHGNRCISDFCPFGRTFGSFFEQPENHLYAPGPCGGGIQR